ncbi:MAG: Benzoyl-CoA reductase subunit B [Chlorobi bacterium OLB4]|jgi:Benzoyl-CoA reductase/2-hydroxyglutaryl-CoA dehydratase subunit, BcrC/BadD/HgdB|nr:MAG: Benzoyl-CoA reductase subunit B [Chlorobi bacterium OLB4]MBW7855190.1 2-hydroxyacyl-CoA dehydratase [Ignavibacteria bacterium]OQY77890.1 MAG: 2-hydroxyglutaryl-CoA dehydratase [Ignavibacteriales bacterium UTCHB1]
MYKIQSTEKMKRIMGEYFLSLESGEKKVAWCTSVGPAELLRSFGFEVYFPENHGALLGATRTAMDYIPEAIKCGYSGHVCSYTTSDIGSYLKGDTPLKTHYGLQGHPKPDIIAYNTNQCREVEDWFTFFANEFKCPIVGIHPPRHLDEITQDEIDLVVKQFKKIIPVCEEVSGNKFNEDKFKEVVKRSKDATLLWQKVLRTSSADTPPISFFDGTIHMGPIVVLRGTETAIDYYSTLLNELEENIANGQGFIKNPRTRIFWEGMPIWGKIRMMSDLFTSNGAAVVASTYCSSWIFDKFDENDPWESTARAYTEIFINRSEKAKMKMLSDWFKEYNIDGIVYHDTKTCFNNSNAKFGMPQRLKESSGIPALVIEGDLCDLRFFSEGQSITKIETFLEQIEESKVYN